MMTGWDYQKLVGRVLESKYAVERHLGSGAMGSVFRARHVRLRRWYAIKLLHPRLLSDPKVQRRFEREAELAGRLDHRNVAGVVDIGEVDGVSYLVMELALGSPLSLVMAQAPFTQARAINLIRQLCDGLDHAHGHGLVHRDIKPDNVIVESSGSDETARIIDFGIAVLRESNEPSSDRLTTGGVVLGTPHYMAPEVATAEPFDHRADLFALGVICYEMLTGRLPFEGDGVAVVHANVHQQPPPMAERAPHVAVEPALEAFTRCLMAQSPADRPASAAAARELVDEIASQLSGRHEPRLARASRRMTPPEALALGSAKTQAVARLEKAKLHCDDESS